MAAHHESPDAVSRRGAQQYSLDLERWWALVRQHLAHPSADIDLLRFDPARELLMQSGWNWAGTKSILDQAMAVVTTQLLRELAPAEHPPRDGA
jgi:hypothetical protein